MPQKLPTKVHKLFFPSQYKLYSWHRAVKLQASKFPKSNGEPRRIGKMVRNSDSHSSQGNKIKQRAKLNCIPINAYNVPRHQIQSNSFLGQSWNVHFS